MAHPPGQSTKKNGSLLAGIAETVINPPPAAPLLGTIQRSTGVHDDLYARALVLNAGTQRIALVCLDLIGMDFVLADEICQAVRARTGITITLLNCSHTHSSPFTIPWSVLGWRWLMGPGKSWRDGLASVIAELVARAEASSFEASLRVGRASVQIGLNRRLPTSEGIVMKPNPDGITVPWVDVLRVDRADGKPAVVLFSHAAHPVIIHGASKLVGADFPGYAASKLKSLFGNEVMTMFAQGCGAQINAEPLRGGYGAAERAGAVLAEAASRAAFESKPVSPDNIKITSMRTELPLQPLPSMQECFRILHTAEDRLVKCCGRDQMSDEQLWDAQDQIDISGKKSSSSADDVQPMDGQLWWLTDNVLCLRDLLDKIERRDERPLRFDAHLLRFGDEWSLLACSHELFAEYQHWFDKNAPTQHKMMWAYTNGCESYIPTDKDLALDGYETATFPSLDSAALKYRHRRALQRGAERQLIEEFRKLWT